MSKSVLSKEEADKVAVAYSPRKFPTTISPAASEFIAFQTSQEASGIQSSFRVDKIVAQTTGIAELERMSIEEKVEREALVRLKDLQEQAYQQAYQLGLDEGRERAYQETSSQLAEKLSHVEQLCHSIENLKSELVTYNERHIVSLVYYMAKKVVMDEISDRQEVILSVVRQAIEAAQSEESVTVRVSNSDLEFIEHIKEKLGKEFESLKRAKFESSEDIASGGCIVETNYGDVNATVEQRVEKLWESIAGKLPRTKDTAGGT